MASAKTCPQVVKYVASLKELRSLGMNRLKELTCSVCLATFTKVSYKNVCEDWHKGRGRG